MTRAVADAESYEQRVAEVQATWREALGRSVPTRPTDRLLAHCPAHRSSPSRAPPRSSAAASKRSTSAICRLLAAGVLEQTTAGRRNRAFEATDLIDAFTDLERRLASPEGDTQRSPPDRRVPRRRP